MLVTPAPISAPMRCPPHRACNWEQRPSTYLGSAVAGCWRSDLSLLLITPGCSHWLSHPLYRCRGTGTQSLPCAGATLPAELTNGYLVCVETGLPERESCYLHWIFWSFSFPGRSLFLSPQASLFRLAAVLSGSRSWTEHLCLSFPSYKMEKFLSPSFSI